MINKEIKNKYKLDFLITEGPASGYRALLPMHTIINHIKKHGNDRPELKNENFLKYDVIDALTKPDYLFPSNNAKKNYYVFYKKHEDRSFYINNQPRVYYTRVIVKRIRRLKKRIIIIVTPHVSAKINEIKKSKPINKI